MDRLLIHIGYHKCASTWLQRHIFSHPERGFQPLCPPSNHGEAPNPKYLATYFIRNEQEQLLSSFRDNSDGLENAIELCTPAARLVPVISSERLSGNPHAGGFDARLIADRLHRRFPRARVMIVIREQVRAAVSMYFMYLAAGGVRSYGHYFMQKYAGRRPGFSLAYLEYDRIVAYYQNLFGRENVMVVPMEAIFSEPEMFRANLVSFSGAEVPGPLPTDSVENRGAPRLVEYYTRYLNLIRKPDSVNGNFCRTPRWVGQGVAGFRQILYRLSGQGWNTAFEKRVLDEIDVMLGERFSKSNRRTEKLTGLKLAADYGYM